MEETLFDNKSGTFYLYPNRKIKLFEKIFNFIKYKDKRCLFENCIPIEVKEFRTSKQGGLYVKQ